MGPLCDNRIYPGQGSGDQDVSLPVILYWVDNTNPTRALDGSILWREPILTVELLSWTMIDMDALAAAVFDAFDLYQSGDYLFLWQTTSTNTENQSKSLTFGVQTLNVDAIATDTDFLVWD